MTTYHRMRPYTNAVTIHLNQAQHEVNKRSMKRQQAHRKRQQLNPQQKIKIVYSKQKGIQFENPTYIQHSECDVDKDTEYWIYYDARYTNPNLRFDKDTESWFHYLTPGLFKNVTNLRFEESTKSWLPAQPHPHVIIIWTNRKQNYKDIEKTDNVEYSDLNVTPSTTSDTQFIKSMYYTVCSNILIL